MCIIVAKSKNKEMPDMTTLFNCFENNPDGAGIAYIKDNKVNIKKGLMSFAEFTEALEEIKKIVDTYKTPLLFHFRIGTAGKNSPQNTHPYSLSQYIEDYKRTEAQADVAVVHNGILPHKYQPSLCNPLDLNDTQVYIKKKLYKYYQKQKDFYLAKNWLNNIAKDTGNKFAFLDKKGNLSLVGNFTEKDGIFYSNSSYISFSYKNYSFEYDKYDVLPYYSEDEEEIKKALKQYIRLDCGDLVVIKEENKEPYYIEIDDDTYYYDEVNAIIYYYDTYYNYITFEYESITAVYNDELVRRA